MLAAFAFPPRRKKRPTGGLLEGPYDAGPGAFLCAHFFPKGPLMSVARFRPAAGAIPVVLLGAVLCLTAPLSGTASAQPLTTISPRDSTDWRLQFRTEGCYVSCRVMKKGDDNRYWVFQGTAKQGDWNQEAQMILRLKDFGMDPVPVEDAEYWAWTWFVNNTQDADRVRIRVEDSEGRGLALAATRSLYDFADDVFPTPDRIREAYTTLSEERKFLGSHMSAVDTLSNVSAVIVYFQAPYQQELWLGPISFGPAREDYHPAERAPLSRTARGRMLCADLDGDGVPEALTPWTAGPKLWRYDRARLGFEPVAGAADLSRARPFNLMVAGDLDGDGDLDLVASDPDDEVLHVLMNRRDGFRGDTLDVPRPGLGSILTDLTLADDDDDGRLDLFIGYHIIDKDRCCIRRAPGLPGGGFGPPVPLRGSRYELLHGIYQIQLADMNGDDVDDIVTASGGEIGIDVLPGLGGGRYGDARKVNPLIGGGFTRGLVLADLDDDGLLDIFHPQISSLRPSSPQMNFTYVNRGDFRFDDVSRRWGLYGDGHTPSAVWAGILGEKLPGLLILDTVAGAVAYDLSPIRRDSEPARADTVLSDTGDIAGAESAAFADLDGDGRVEAIIGRADGISVVPLPGTGPVKRVRLRDPGPNSGGIGRVVCGSSGWRLPLVSTNRVGPLPLLVAASESVWVEGGPKPGPSVTTPGGLETLRFRAEGDPFHAGSAVVAWLRWKAPKLWEYPWLAARERTVQAGLGLLLLLTAGGVTLRSRRASRKTEEQNWRELLARIGFSSHAAWRKAVTNLSRAARQVRDDGASEGSAPGPEELARLREHVPPEILASIREGVEIAWMLRLDGARTAREALDALDRLHRDAHPDLDRLLAAGKGLESSLNLIQGPLARRFTCDAEAAYRRLLRFRRPSLDDALETGWIPDGEGLARRFPLKAEDLFACLDEFLANAMKKNPRPGRVLVTVRAPSPQVAILELWDDGASMGEEWSRDGRVGSRSGLRRLSELLAPYGGNVRLLNGAKGGVIAQLRTPRFDLD